MEDWTGVLGEWAEGGGGTGVEERRVEVRVRVILLVYDSRLLVPARLRSSSSRIGEKGSEAAILLVFDVRKSRFT